MEETDLRPIPLHLLCPRCKRGWMKSSDVDGDQAKVGPYKRAAQFTCDNDECKFSERRYTDYFGVLAPRKSRPSEPTLFD